MSNDAASEPEIDLDAVRANARAFAESRAAIGEEKWLRELETYIIIEDDVSRYSAVNEISRLECPPYETLVRWTEDELPVVREMACELLGHYKFDKDQLYSKVLKYPQALSVLLPMLNDSEARVRSAAVSAVRQHQVPVCISAFLQMTEEPSEEARFAVACAISSFGETYWQEYGEKDKPAIQAALLRFMDDEDEDIRNWITFNLYQYGHDTPEIHARLWKALDDPYIEVRREAALALATFNERSFIPRLTQILREGKPAADFYFEVAEVFNAPILLSAVLEAAEVWRESLKEGEKLPSEIASVIEKLQETAASMMRTEDT